MITNFIQHHRRCFWRKDKLKTDESPLVRHFPLMPTTTPAIAIDVIASNQDDCLQLSYFLGNTGLTLGHLHSLQRADFLWQQTCLECFFDFGQCNYFELNFTPTGKYNLYHFDDYRMPNTLPPTWANGDVCVVYSTTVKHFYAYHLKLRLDGVSSMENIQHINPTAIIYHTDTPNFYAVHHAMPPDFHNKKFWQEF